LKENELTKDDLKFLMKQIKSYQNGSIYSIILLPLLYYGFYYFNFPLKKLDLINGFGMTIQLIVLGMLTYIIIKGIERSKNLKHNLIKQKKITGHFKIIEKEITNKNDPDEWSHYVIKIFSEFENKNKYIFLNRTDYRRISVEDLIYVEYFTDSNLIKTLNYKNRKLEYLRYQIYDNTWG